MSDGQSIGGTTKRQQFNYVKLANSITGLLIPSVLYETKTDININELVSARHNTFSAPLAVGPTRGAIATKMDTKCPNGHEVSATELSLNRMVWYGMVL